MIYASGPRKKHGCLIAFDRSQYEQIGEKVIHMDTVEIGASFKTKNIGSLVAIQSRKSDWGILVATTHLFWHPSLVLTITSENNTAHNIAQIHVRAYQVCESPYVHRGSCRQSEARQAGILLRATTQFRTELGKSWPCIIAGGLFALLLTLTALTLLGRLQLRAR
jgi:RNA exonuclease NGL2